MWLVIYSATDHYFLELETLKSMIEKMMFEIASMNIFKKFKKDREHWHSGMPHAKKIF
jgi:hypothetical protein